MGDNAGSAGTMTVDGAGSAWTNSSDLRVGNFGSGTLTIGNGGAVSNGGWAAFGYAAGQGSGTLTISNGGTMSNVAGFLGNQSGATGTATVDGAGSTWTSIDLNVGTVGNGTLTIRNGGAVNNGWGFIGRYSGSTGAATVDGAGSAWTNSGDLRVGYFGSGALTIRNGGAVSNGGWAAIGAEAGSTGAVTVDGASSTLTTASDFYVGNLGSATLTIRNGGAVSNGDGFIGRNSGAIGAVTVDGAGSTWTNSRLYVGSFGSGALTIRNGGSVSASLTSVAKQTNSTGTLNIGAAVGQSAAAPGTLNTPTVDFGNGTGQLVFNHTSANYVFAPVITRSGTGTGTVRVEAGKTILTAASTYTGPTIINGGTLSMNGSIASSAVTVNAGGTLGGNGTVGNTTINGGALAPGNSIGLLTVNGSLSFTAASSYMVEVSPANADRVNVTGTATLSGATVNASFALAAGSPVAKQYTIVNAGGGVSGTFGSVVNSNLPSGFKSSLSYDANNAYLNLALNFVAPPGSGLNRNQQAVADALVNSFNRNGGIPLVYGGLTAPGLTQASGQIATAVQPAMVQAMTQFMTGITEISAADRRHRGSNATGFAAEDDVMNAYAAVRLRGTDGETLSLKAKAAPPVPAFESYWRVWASGFGGGQTTDGNAVTGSDTATSRVYGVAAGAITGSRRRRSQASRWRAAAPISASPPAAADEPTCSRPAHSSSTRPAPPMTARPRPMAGMTSRPIAR
jgi:T5SS/PEP-CTERM-associated repeat protein/autotransporter-associated beta strand protein